MATLTIHNKSISYNCLQTGFVHKAEQNRTLQTRSYFANFWPEKNAVNNFSIKKSRYRFSSATTINK